MRGLQIWAHSYCRSTFALYDELGKFFNVPVRICLGKTGKGVRDSLGLPEDEFRHIDVKPIGDDKDAAFAALEGRQDWHQLFGAYQELPVLQRMILAARDFGCPIGLFSEAPMNMYPPGALRLAKLLYMRKMLPATLRQYIAASAFIINWSGDNSQALTKIGWPAQKIIPFGYYSPPLNGSEFRERAAYHHRNFLALCTGEFTWHRGQDVLVRALTLLKGWGLPHSVIFTQNGPAAEKARSIAEENGLDCVFAGKVPMGQLSELYQNCSVFIGAGRAEPWGIRVNDALLCGAPLLISRGMGAKKLVDDYGFGLTFEADDPIDLAWKLRRLIEDRDLYLDIAGRVRDRRLECTPSAAAEKLGTLISRNWNSWVKGGCASMAPRNSEIYKEPQQPQLRASLGPSLIKKFNSKI